MMKNPNIEKVGNCLEELYPGLEVDNISIEEYEYRTSNIEKVTRREPKAEK